MNYERFSLNFSDGILCGSIDEPNAKNFAFYLFRNDKRIDIQWYSASREFAFDLRGLPGFYHVAAFIELVDGSKISRKSFPKIVNPRIIEKIDLEAIDSSEIYFHLKACFSEIPFLYFPSGKKRLFVLLQSAITRSAHTLPAFMRWNWARLGLFPGDVLCIADTTIELHKDMSIGYYLGNPKSRILDDVVGIVSSVAKNNGIPNRDIYFWGSSAGGYSALSLAAKLPGSTAVSINGQTNILRYHVKQQVDLIREFCFDGLSSNAVSESYPNLVDMVAVWGKEGSSRAVMVQNLNDRHHFDDHFVPFFEKQIGVAPFEKGWSNFGNHMSWIYEDSRGHAPETEDMASEIIEKIIAKP